MRFYRYLRKKDYENQQGNGRSGGIRRYAGNGHTGNRAGRVSRRLLSMALLLVLTAGLLAGCGKNSEAQQKYKKAGIEAIEKEKYSEAIRDFNKALSESGTQIDNSVIDINYYKAAAQILEGKDKDALSTYTRIIEYKGKNPDAYYLRGALYFRQKKVKTALQDFRKSIALNTKDYDRYFRIYNILENGGQDAEASKILDLLLGVNDSGADAYQAKGRALEIRKDYGAALTDYQKALKKGKKEARIDMARVYSTQKKTKQAADALKKYQKSASPTGESWNAIGELQLAEGKPKDALKSFRAGLKLKLTDNRQELLRNEIVALERSGDFTAAAKKCASYIKSYPQDEEMQREYLFLKTR